MLCLSFPVQFLQHASGGSRLGCLPGAGSGRALEGGMALTGHGHGALDPARAHGLAASTGSGKDKQITRRMIPLQGTYN